MNKENNLVYFHLLLILNFHCRQNWLGLLGSSTKQNAWAQMFCMVSITVVKSWQIFLAFLVPNMLTNWISTRRSKKEKQSKKRKKRITLGQYLPNLHHSVNQLQLHPNNKSTPKSKQTFQTSCWVLSPCDNNFILCTRLCTSYCNKYLSKQQEKLFQSLKRATSLGHGYAVRGKKM